VRDSASSPRPRRFSTVFLDRDGVINAKMPEGSYVRSPAELTLLDGAAGAIARLNRAGFRVIVASNQRGIALGLYTAEDVQAIHSALQDLLARQDAHVDAFYFCPHDRGQCNCRKPLPGLFEQAVAEFPQIAAEASAMLGDSLSDVEFARRLGMAAILIEGGPDRREADAAQAEKLADLRFHSLAAAVEFLVESHA